MKNKYQAVPGREDGQVEVLVRKNVLERWGSPTVNFAGLTAMVRELGLPPEDTKIKLFSGRWVGGTGELKKLARGGHIPLTHTIYAGVGVNGTIGLPHPSSLPEETRKELDGAAQTATMSKLVHSVLRASNARGSVIHERERELYEAHAADIQFRNPSPDAR